MRRLLAVAVLALVPSAAFAQLSPSATWAAHAANQYQVAANITYLTASNYEAKLDIYSRRGATTPQPTVVYFHGGFWAAGSKEGSLMSLLPWMEMGWNVVNVEYRLARVALAPAAVEDCLCALRYIAAQAKTYNIDVNRIVLTGESAGGHLTLTTGMIPESSGLGLHAALAKAGVTNQLLTIPGGKHGNFTPDERTKIFTTIREFLKTAGLPVG